MRLRSGLNSMKRAMIAAFPALAVLSVQAGVWCYRPYEYEAWMLQRMRADGRPVTSRK